MKSLLFFVVTCLSLVGCKNQSGSSSGSAHTSAGLAYPMAESWEQSERRLKREREIDDRYKAEYAEKYKPWRCDQSELPVVKTFDVEDGTSVLALSHALHLRLRFGKWLDPERDHRDFRSETRYILFIPPAKKLGEAEGKLSDGGQGTQAPYGTLHVRFNPDTQSVEMDEEFSGVGDSFRQIVFLPKARSPLDANGVPRRWQTYHLELPLRQVIWDNGQPGRIHGVSHGKSTWKSTVITMRFPWKSSLWPISGSRLDSTTARMFLTAEDTLAGFFA